MFEQQNIQFTTCIHVSRRHTLRAEWSYAHSCLSKSIHQLFWFKYSLIHRLKPRSGVRTNSYLGKLGKDRAHWKIVLCRVILHVLRGSNILAVVCDNEAHPAIPNNHCSPQNHDLHCSMVLFTSLLPRMFYSGGVLNLCYGLLHLGLSTIKIFLINRRNPWDNYPLHFSLIQSELWVLTVLGTTNY